MRVLRALGEEAPYGRAPLVSMVVAFHHVYTNHANSAASFAPRQSRRSGWANRKCMYPAMFRRFQLESGVWRQTFGLPHGPVHGFCDRVHAGVQ